MKLIQKLLILCAIPLISACNQDSYQKLAAGFKTPADSVQTAVYWYWISDNLSKEGVVKDLQAMKQAGINRAFIGNIGINDLPFGNVKIFTPEWWDILHTALKTATELNIEIGIFNSPGWSQSGGPWVKPNQTMRYLVSSQAIVSGPGVTTTLPEIDQYKDFQPVKLIAYPRPTDYAKYASADEIANINIQPSVNGASALIDNDPATFVALPGEKQIDIQLKEPFTCRTLILHTPKRVSIAQCELQAKSEDGSFTPISQFRIDRHNFAINVGDPQAPTVVSFADVTSDSYRLIIRSASPQFAFSEIQLSAEPQLGSYPEKSLTKMFQDPLPYWHEYQWKYDAEPQQSTTIDPSKVIDISDKIAADGSFKWEVPAGEWVILRTGMIPTGVTNSPATPEGTGLEIDKLSKEHVASHFDKFIGEILRRIPEQDRKTFRVVVQDSYETGGQNFTDTMLEDFKAQYGYDPLPYLPAMQGKVVGSRLESDRFLWDLRRLVADKVAYDYVAGLREISHQYGLRTWLENYGHWGFPGEFLQYGGQSDEIGGEFWSYGNLGDIENRAASSCGHIYGKQKIWAESFTCGPDKPFSRYPAEMKQRGDRFFAEGINSTLLHVYIQQPDETVPGRNAWFGNEFNRHNTWFSHLDLFTTYLKRTNYMLQQGLNVADIAYFIGEDAPKMTGITNPVPPKGFQFDYINAEVILRDITVRNGKLTLPHGTQYEILVLPELKSMRPEVLEKLAALVNDGATILGPAPEYSPSLQNQPQADARVKELAQMLWNGETKENKVGKGRVLNHMNLEEAFQIMNIIPDCSIPDNIHYGHRVKGDIDIYFLSNQSDQTTSFTAKFRTTGATPEYWSATNGSIRILPEYKQNDLTTEVPLTLAPFESAFIVFASQAQQEPTVITKNFPEGDLITSIESPWSVIFKSEKLNIDKKIVFDTLTSWSNHEDPEIRYYSGCATYNNSFEVDTLLSGKRVMLNVNKVTAMAKIYLNGQYAGGLWTAPYQIDITDFIQKGNNDIRIEVVNTWQNRLIYDSSLPEEQRKTWSPYQPWKITDSLQESGLIGPVTITTVDYKLVSLE